MALRYDQHRPSVINPDDYEFVANEFIKIEDVGDIEFLRMSRDDIRRHMERTGGTYSKHTHGGNCHICGSVNAIYTTLFYHKPSNTYIRCGSDCAEKLEYYGANEFRRNVQDALRNKAGKAKAALLLSEKGLDKVYLIYSSSDQGNEETIIRDIVGKLVQYDSLSDKQFNFLSVLVNKIETRQERKAKQQAEYNAAETLPPTGDRLEIIGEVLCRKPREFGADKLLIKSKEGWKVWGTVPSSISQVVKGNKVSFFARIEPSKDDNKFGFYSRPSKARII